MLKKSLILTAVLAVMASTSFAASGIGFGVHGGLVTGFNNQTLEQSVRQAGNDFSNFKFSHDMTDMGIHLDMNTLQVIAFDIYADYMWKTFNHSFTSGGVSRSGNVRFSDVSLSGDVKATFPLAVLMPYVGVGLGVHKSVYSSTFSDVTVVLPEENARFGWNAKAGLALNMPSFRPFVEYKYTSVEAPHSRVVGVEGARMKYQSLLFGITIK